MSPFVDASVYPDEQAPTELITPEEQADYLHRVVGAFDYGITPEEPTLRLFSGWRDVFDRVPLLRSPGYHALRAFFGWPALPRGRPFSEPTYRILDSIEGREDGFEDRV